MKRAFKMKQKAFFFISERLSLKQIKKKLWKETARPVNVLKRDCTTDVFL